MLKGPNPDCVSDQSEGQSAEVWWVSSLGFTLPATMKLTSLGEEQIPQHTEREQGSPSVKVDLRQVYFLKENMQESLREGRIQRKVEMPCKL